MKVTFDDPVGFVRAGTACAPCLAAGADGSVRVGGALVRPVTFGERSVSAATALRASDPTGALCAALRARAVAEPAAEPLDAALLDCVVLALAGSEEEDAPSFADVALAFARASGGDLASVLGAPAREIDVLWAALAGSREPVADDGWTRALFVPAAEDPPAEAVRDELAAVLLRRAAPLPAAGAALEPATVTAAGTGARADAAPVPTRDLSPPAPESPPQATRALEDAAAAPSATRAAVPLAPATRSRARLIASSDVIAGDRAADEPPAAAAPRRAGLLGASENPPRARIWTAGDAAVPRPAPGFVAAADAPVAIAPPVAAAAAPDRAVPAPWPASVLRPAPPAVAGAPGPAAEEPVALRDRGPAVTQDLAELLAAALDEQADLRGVAR